MSVTPKITRKEHGYYTWQRYQPARPIGDSARDNWSGVDRWYCRRHCSATCEAGRQYRRISGLRTAYRRRR